MKQSAVLSRRRSERDRLLERARNYVALLGSEIGAAIVFGSVARGDFNVWSDVDLLLVARELPAGWQNRLESLPPRPASVQPIAWTIAEWHAQLARGNPIAREAVKQGVWLRGSPERLRSDMPR